MMILIGMVNDEMIIVSCVYLFSMLSLFATKKNGFKISLNNTAVVN